MMVQMISAGDAKMWRRDEMVRAADDMRWRREDLLRRSGYDCADGKKVHYMRMCTNELQARFTKWTISMTEGAGALDGTGKHWQALQH